jgi:hypothetical protein
MSPFCTRKLHNAGAGGGKILGEVQRFAGSQIPMIQTLCSLMWSYNAYRNKEAHLGAF